MPHSSLTAPETDWIQNIWKIAQKTLHQLKVSQFEIYIKKYQSLQIDSKDQKIDTFLKSEDIGFAIRLIRNQKMGFSYTTSYDPHWITQSIHRAFEVAEWMPVDPYHHFIRFQTHYPTLSNFDSAGLAISIAQKIEFAKNLESLCRKTDPRIQTVRLASITQTEARAHLIDSEENHVSHQSTSFSASITCKAEENQDSQMGCDYSFSNFLDKLNLQEVGQNAAHFAIELLGARPATNFNGPVVLRNQVVSELLEFLSSSFSAEETDKNRSIFKNKLHQKLFPSHLHISQDPLRLNGLNQSPFDAEGMPVQKTHLIQDGIFSNFLYNTYYANKYQTTSTGSAVREIKAPPTIGYGNLWLQPGIESLEALISTIEKGIFITDIMGLHTGNPITGQFSVGASGLQIEQGKLTHPLRGFAISGNILNIFQNVVALGNDLKFFGRTASPSIQLKALLVSGV